MDRLSNGVVPALSDGVTAFTEENDGVIFYASLYPSIGQLS
mgnify:CR=1 FL=1